MNTVEYLGWITVGVILLVQIIQQILLDGKFQSQVDDLRVMKQKQDQLKETVSSLEANIQGLRKDLAKYAVTSANLAVEVTTLVTEVDKIQSAVISSTEKRD